MKTQEWEDVCGLGKCERCGQDMGSMWQASGSEEIYFVPAHGRMGNRSYRLDDFVGSKCDCQTRRLAAASSHVTWSAQVGRLVPAKYDATTGLLVPA